VYKQEAPHMQDTVNKKGYTIDFFHPIHPSKPINKKKRKLNKQFVYKYITKKQPNVNMQRYEGAIPAKALFFSLCPGPRDVFCFLRRC